MFCNNSTQAFPQWAAKSQEDNSFKTSNSKIFPSLNPLGSFYKQRKTAIVHPNPSLQGHSESSEPVKKQRLNNGLEEIVKQQAPQKPQGRAPVQSGQIDKDGFRIPQLPKRLQKKNVEERVSQKKSRKVEKKVVEQPLVVQDNVMQGFKDLQHSLINLSQFDNAANNSKIETPMMIQSNDISAALYERLTLEYYSMILKENIEHLSKLSQKTEKLLQNHNVNPLMYNSFPMSQSVQLY